MHTRLIVLLGLAILAYGSIGFARRSKAARFPHLKGWRKVFGILAFVLVVLVVINPELFALGLLGDTAFFDVFVLLLSLQFQAIAVRTWHCVREVLSSMMGAVVPRLSLSFERCLMIFAPLAGVIAEIQKANGRGGSGKAGLGLL
jgi:hypothetical protein